MNRVVRRLAASIEAARPSANEQERQALAYGLSVLWNDLTKLPLLLLAFSILFSFREALTVMAFWSILRIWMGGYHSRTWLGCFLSACCSYLASLFLARWLHPSPWQQVLLLAAGLLLVMMLAPVDHPNKPIRSAGRRNRMRWTASIAFAVESVLVFLVPPWAGRIGLWTLLVLVTLMVAGGIQKKMADGSNDQGAGGPAQRTDRSDPGVPGTSRAADKEESDGIED